MDVDALKSVAFFSELEQSEVEALAGVVSELTVPEGKEIVREGDYSYELFVIEEGSASVLRDGQAVAELGPGDFFGEAGVIDKAQRSATIRADSRLRLVVIDHWAFDRLRKSVPNTVERIQQVMNERSS